MGEKKRADKQRAAEERRNWDTPERRATWRQAVFHANERQKTLTDVQWWVARLISHGFQDKNIATELDIGLQAVKGHVAAIKRKAKVDNRTQIARWFMGH